MENKSHWFAWFIYECELGSLEYVQRALSEGAEVYRHEGLNPHYYCLLYVAKPESNKRMKTRLGRSSDKSFGIPQNPDAMRRYISACGKRVTSV